MKTNYPIPHIMRNLPIDDRGYVIPYFTPIVNGVPDFRYQDEKKRQNCFNYNLCSICGKKLIPRIFWFISGPLGLKNKTASDAPMHEECARYSINVCPHMIFQKAERRSEGGPHTPEPFLMTDKPETLYLIKADKYRLINYGGHTYIRFRPIFTEAYGYENNRLIKKEQ